MDNKYVDLTDPNDSGNYKMSRERLLEILDNILAWGNDHSEEFRECMLYAMDLTEDEARELDLMDYVKDYDEWEEN